MARWMNNLITLGVVGVAGFILYDYFINPRCKHWIPLFNSGIFDTSCVGNIPVVGLSSNPLSRFNAEQGRSLREVLAEAAKNIRDKTRGKGDSPAGIGRDKRDGGGSGASGSRSGGSGASRRAKADDSFLDIYRQIQEAAEDAQLTADAKQNLGAQIAAAILGPTIPIRTDKGKKLNSKEPEKTALEQLIDNAIKSAKEINTQDNILFELFAGIQDEARTSQIRSSVISDKLAKIADATRTPYCGPKPEWWDVLGNLQRGACILSDAISGQAESTQKINEENLKRLGLPEELARTLKPRLIIP